jgi:hypothetical protein
MTNIDDSKLYYKSTEIAHSLLKATLNKKLQLMIEIHKAKGLHDSEGFKKVLNDKATSAKKDLKEMLEEHNFKI